MNDEFPEVRQLQYMNAWEAVELWNGITGDELTRQEYEARCASGALARMGVDLRHDGGTWLTDMDSLLAALERSITAQYERVREALEERRLELEGF